MSIWDSAGRRRAVWRKVAPFLSIVASVVLFVVCARVLWLAYATHSILMPLRRHMRQVVLEQEPGFFWAAVVVYGIVVVCAPVAAVAQVEEIRFWARHRKGR